MAPLVVHITSFGFLHGDPPDSHIRLDLRVHFRDPHIDPALREMTADDWPVQRAVLRTPGIRRLLRATVRQARAYNAGPSGNHLAIATGCAGGRHRAAVTANLLARRLRRRGFAVTVHHRDLRKPVVQR